MTEAKKPLNRRKYDRYFIDEIPVEGIGSVVEVCRKGLKIKKAPGFALKSMALNFKISSLEIKTDVKWEDKDFLGLQLSGAFNDHAFIVKRMKKPKEAVIPPQMTVHEKAIQQYKKDEILTKTVDLLMEVDSPEPNMKKIAGYIEEISRLEEIKQQEEIKKQEELKKQAEQENKGEGEAVQEAGKKEARDEKAKDKEAKARERLLKEEVIIKASGPDMHSEGRLADIEFAINRLGYDKVRALLRKYFHKRIFQSEGSLSAFEDYEIYNILKSVVFRKLCHFFGLFDIQPEGNALLSCETVGVEILIRESNGILDNFYKSTSRLYSEVSLMYEKSLFGIDPVEINKAYLEKGLGAFEELYDGYVLAYNALNPHYTPSEKVKISFSGNGLVFSYLAYLTFLALEFLMDKDGVSGFVLSKRLSGKEMNREKVLNFFDETVTEAKKIINDFALKDRLARPSLPSGPSGIENYFGKDKRAEYLLRSFRDFNVMNLRRMALRYEDASYAHFMLGKIMDTDGFGLNSRRLVVVPCGNVSEVQWRIRDFAYFDLLVFKDINKLPPVHMAAFIKLWSSFEGQIMVTFNRLDFLDYTNTQLYSLFSSYIVDFPSYFFNDTIYGKMVENATNYLKPYIGKQQVETARYTNEVYTMNHIKTDVLLNKDIS